MQSALCNTGELQSEVLSKPTVNNKAEPQPNTATLCGAAARAGQIRCNCRCSADCGDRPADDCSKLQTSHRDRRAAADELFAMLTLFLRILS